MHASMFHLDLGDHLTTRERAQRGRALAAALAGLPGFVAFIAIEAEDGKAAGFCICVDAPALESARLKVEQWQRDEGGDDSRPPDQPQSEPTLQIQDSAPPITIEALASGEVIVQRGF